MVIEEKIRYVSAQLYENDQLIWLIYLLFPIPNFAPFLCHLVSSPRFYEILSVLGSGNNF